MSLINEALKRAEREKAGKSPTPAGSPQPSAPPGTNAPRRSPRLAPVALLGLVLAGAVASVMYLSLPQHEKPVPSPLAGGETAAPASLEPAPREQDNTRVTALRVPDWAVPPAQPPPAHPAPEAISPPWVQTQPPVVVLRQPTSLPSAASATTTQPAPQPAPRSDPSPGRDFKLGGIMRSGGVASAIINGHLLTVGESIDGARLLAVERYHVEMEKDGRKFTLRL